MSTSNVAVGELRREGVWALRALGFPFAVAERAVPLLLWTQAVHGSALAVLRHGEQRIIESCALPPARREGGPQPGWQLDAGGRCLLELGPVAIDLATWAAREHGAGRVVVQGGIGSVFADALQEPALLRGLGAVAVYVSGVHEFEAGRFAVAGWVAAHPSASGPVFLAGSLDDGDGHLLDVLARTPMALEQGAANTLETDFAAVRAARARGTGLLVLLLLRCDAASPAPGAQSGLPITDFAARVAKANCDGVEVDTADYLHLYALEHRTWAPSSDRSRRQAAF